MVVRVLESAQAALAGAEPGTAGVLVGLAGEGSSAVTVLSCLPCAVGDLHSARGESVRYLA